MPPHHHLYLTPCLEREYCWESSPLKANQRHPHSSKNRIYLLLLTSLLLKNNPPASDWIIVLVQCFLPDKVMIHSCSTIIPTKNIEIFNRIRSCRARLCWRETLIAAKWERASNINYYLLLLRKLTMVIVTIIITRRWSCARISNGKEDNTCPCFTLHFDHCFLFSL